MTARLLREIELRASSISDANERLILRAERAGVLARLGRTGDARSEIALLRKLNPNFSPRLAAWILFSEGLVEHFESLSPSAKDRFSRSHAIAEGIGDSRLRGRSAAWIAYWDFRQSDFPSAIARMEEALTLGDMTDNTMLSRAWLVFADLCALAGMDAGHRYFSFARRFAVADGDIGMQSVILFNSVGHSLVNLAICDALDAPTHADSTLVELELSSIANLDTGVGIVELQAATRLCQAQLAVCKKDWRNGLRLYDENLEEACERGQGQWRARHLAEAALCAANLGMSEKSQVFIEQACLSLGDGGDTDDLAIANGRIAAAFLSLGDESQWNARMLTAREHLARFRAEQRDLAALLEPVASRLQSSFSLAD